MEVAWWLAWVAFGVALAIAAAAWRRAMRAQQRWQHIIDGHADLAYDYMTPGARSTKTREAWAKGRVCS